MPNIDKLEQRSETRAFVEAVWFPKHHNHVMNVLQENRRIYGKVPMRAFTGSKGRLREASRWEFNPQTLKEAETFRMPREDRGKHLSQFVPCANAPVVKVLSFHERNLIRRFGKVPHHLSAS